MLKKRNNIINLLKKYEKFYKNRGSFLVETENVLRHNDTSINFINSTTSVMKPYILSNYGNRTGVLFMIQPSIGTQGVQLRLKKQEFGKYTSYFLSLGALYFNISPEEVIIDLKKLIQTFGLQIEELLFMVYEKDVDIMQYLLKNGINFVADENVTPYRHKYGLNNIFGRNFIVVKNKTGAKYEMFCLTLIESEHGLMCTELSADSTQIVSGLLNFNHAMCSLPGFNFLNINQHNDQVKNSYLALLDSLNVIVFLLSEELIPTSRGKSGLLRIFFKEVVELMNELDINLEYVNNLVANIYEEIEDELVATNYTLNKNFSIIKIQRLVAEWVGRISLQKK